MDYWPVFLSQWDRPIVLAERVGQITLAIGVVVTVFLLIVGQFVRARELYGSGDPASQNQRTNCPSCGARISAKTDTCDYCGESTTR